MKNFISVAVIALCIGQIEPAQSQPLNPLSEAANLGLGKGMNIYNNITTKPPSSDMVPGFSGATQPQQTYFSGGNGDLVSPGVGRSSGCATEGDPECLAVNLLNWGPNNRVLPPLSTSDTLIKGSRDVYNNPNATLGSFADSKNNTAGQIGGNTQVCETVSVNVPADYLDQICNESVQIDEATCNSVRVVDLDPWTTYRCLNVKFDIEAKTCRIDQIVEVRADHDYRCERITQNKTSLSCKKYLSVACEQPQPDGCQTGGIIPGSTQGDMLTSFNHIGGGTYQLQFGTIADNYWSGYGAIFDRTLEFQISNVQEVTEFRLVRAAYDDWLLVNINGSVVYVGPHPGTSLNTIMQGRIKYVTTGGEGFYNVELGTSWDLPLNIDLRSYLVSGVNRIFTRTIVGGNGESAIQINARMACPFVCRDEWINGCAALESRQ